MKAYIPTPSKSFVSVGPFTIHFYALCIILGILVAIWVARKRTPENSQLISDIAIYGIPAGIIGARLYHVITTPDKYFNRHFPDAFKIWEGGLGIWGAIAGGFLAAAILLKRRGKLDQLLIIADAVAPGLLFAQAIGRVGNWFNGELFGRPSSVPWALEIPLSKRPEKYLEYQTFHPTFLYESIWCLVIGFILLKLNDKNPGQIFWLYVALYSLGRLFIEAIRSDYALAFLGIRINIWVAATFSILGAWQYLKNDARKIR